MSTPKKPNDQTAVRLKIIDERICLKVKSEEEENLHLACYLINERARKLSARNPGFKGSQLMAYILLSHYLEIVKKNNAQPPQ